MVFLDSLEPDMLEHLSDVIGKAILSTISTVGTKYVGGNEDFSGTGLLVSDGAKKYVFTANHVLDPSIRIPPRSGEVEISYHSLGLQKNGSPAQSYALRRKYWRSEIQDLALIESAISERLNIDRRTDYYPVDKLITPINFDPYLKDLFVVCGFPAEKRLHIPAVRETKHAMLIHYFSGQHGRDDPKCRTRFRLKFNGKSVSPSGMSRAPVWLIRNSENIGAPLDIEHIRSLFGRKYELVAQFMGIVVEYFKDANEIAAVKSDICAEFVKKALRELPGLRSADEDEWIEQQLCRYKNNGVRSSFLTE